MNFVIARSGNKRPTLMHLVAPNDWTACGIDIRPWSRAYVYDPIPQILCLKCKKKVNS